MKYLRTISDWKEAKDFDNKNRFIKSFIGGCPFQVSFKVLKLTAALI